MIEVGYSKTSVSCSVEYYDKNKPSSHARSIFFENCPRHFPFRNICVSLNRGNASKINEIKIIFRFTLKEPTSFVDQNGTVLVFFVDPPTPCGQNIFDVGVWVRVLGDKVISECISMRNSPLRFWIYVKGCPHIRSSGSIGLPKRTIPGAAKSHQKIVNLEKSLLKNY